MADRLHFSPEARKYFSKIGIRTGEGDTTTQTNSQTGVFDTFFDPWWLCAQIGLYKKEYIPYTGKQMVKGWYGLSKVYKEEILGIAFHHFCVNKGYGGANKRIILGEMEKFFHEENIVWLGSEGYDFLNSAAEGGFQYIKKRYEDGFQDKAQFLMRYIELFD